jgi:hypothetical protein
MDNAKLTDVAILGRIYPQGANWRRFEHIVPREDLPKLTVCTRHDRLIYYDEFGCPCCILIAEYEGGRRVPGKGQA